MACSHPTMWVSSKPSLSDTTSLCFLSSLNPFHPPSSLAANNPSRSSSATPIHCGLVELRSRIDSHNKLLLMGSLSLRLLLKFFITSMNSLADDIDIPLPKVRPVKKVALVVTGDRGLSEDEFFRLTTKDGKLTVERGVTRTETSDFSPILQFEQNPVQILDALLPLYLNSQLAARMSAMSNATDKCISIEENLSIIFNRQRQAKITGEILEIVAGVNALT
ncbi:ATP synthase gamma chain [Salix suchowensis]|nr:ATP synthase gamma chain [Salix suchowensis]